MFSISAKIQLFEFGFWNENEFIYIHIHIHSTAQIVDERKRSEYSKSANRLDDMVQSKWMCDDKKVHEHNNRIHSMR